MTELEREIFMRLLIDLFGETCDRAAGEGEAGCIECEDRNGNTTKSFSGRLLKENIGCSSTLYAD